MKRLKNRYRVLLIIILGGLLYYAYHYWKYTPQRNPHPQYFMTVSGNVDPSLVGRINLRWQGQYESINPACDTAGKAWIEGAYTSRMIKVIKPVEINRNGAYKFVFILDAYQPGFCQWQPTYFTLYTLHHEAKDYLFAVNFTHQHQAQIKSSPIKLACTITGACHNIQHPRLLNTMLLGRHSSYRITIKLLQSA